MLDHLRQIIPYGLAKIEFSVVDPAGWTKYLKTLGPSKPALVKAEGEQFLKNRIHSLQATGQISSPEILAQAADRLCSLDPDQMRRATA